MPLNWMKDIRNQDINSLLLMESVQLSWIPEGYLRREWALVLRANPHIAWYIAHKCHQKAAWVDGIMVEAAALPMPGEDALRAACGDILQAFEDWVIYALDPQIYADQPHNSWDERELTGLCDFAGRRVVDIGSGTGKQAFAVAGIAREVYCVEPVASLREYLRAQAMARGFGNVHVVDGLIARIPFEDGFADVVTSGHVFGDEPEKEYAEIMRVLRPGGMLALVPGNSDDDDETHAFLTGKGCEWARFEEPGDGMKRKYWVTKQ